jgi:hypothetical protein
MDKNELRKDLYKSKVIAKFSHYISGNLYYTVDVYDSTYQFPIPTIEDLTITSSVSTFNGIKLSSDLGTTSFYNEMKGSELNRWIGKAIDNKEFIKL